MKLKQRPEDFQVEEITDLPFQPAGPFALYRLEKRGWTTHDALALVQQRWKVDRRRVSFGGLKDRHAQSSQHFTIFRGPQRGLTQQGIAVRYLGQTSEPFASQHIRANRFRIALRAIDPARMLLLEQTLHEVRRDGLPNYFDDQRFGSVADGRFAARELVLGRFEEGLRLALTVPYEFDRAQEKRAKALLRRHWGNWQELKQRLPPGQAQRLVSHLANHPDDFRGALARLQPELRSLYLSAYQSHLWNRLLARWLEQHTRPEQRILIRLRLGAYPMHRQLDPAQHGELAALQLPLPSARTKLPADDPCAPLIDAILAEESLHLEQLQIQGIRAMFFSKGNRAALCMPGGLRWEDQSDDLHPGRRQAILHFDLPRGCYATLIVKRVQQAGELGLSV